MNIDLSHFSAFLLESAASAHLAGAEGCTLTAEPSQFGIASCALEAREPVKSPSGKVRVRHAAVLQTAIHPAEAPPLTLTF